MPQLDHIIIFTQIFWLFVIFSTLYAILTHFFLPLILKSFKSRRLILESNSKETNDLINKIKKKHVFLQNQLLESFLQVENHLIKNLIDSKFENFNTWVQAIDEKIAKACIDQELYCNIHLLESIILFPRTPLI
uniref:ATP synthase F0 subunit 8 n=1 Tax=Kappaphycus striatus TaxID=88410 RepID=A0A059T1W1_9FLOR|nr:ATP synthase F0 subunit 8 [Kappaphycus striatus]AHG98596.1 ATP synthase F0 subunit 8 [Kappaphycus striatus]